MELTASQVNFLCDLHVNGPTHLAHLPRTDHDTLKRSRELASKRFVIIHDNGSMPTVEITDEGLLALKRAFSYAAMTDIRERPKVSPAAVDFAIDLVAKRLRETLKEKGHGSFVSRHEVVGMIEEEFDELKSEVHANSEDSDVISELADIAVPAIFGIASIKEGAMI